MKLIACYCGERSHQQLCQNMATLKSKNIFFSSVFLKWEGEGDEMRVR
jgi:hypothetical protein